MSNNELSPRPGASPSLVQNLHATVYGPAMVGTIRVDDPRALAELRSARAPALPRPAPAPAPAWSPASSWQHGVITERPPPVPALALVGTWLAVLVPPVGLVVSAVALARILRTHPRPSGELLAGFAMVTALIMMCAVLAIVLG